MSVLSIKDSSPGGLTISQWKSLVIFADSPIGGYYRGRRGALVHARTEVLAHKGLIVRRIPIGTGWDLTEAGHVKIAALAGLQELIDVMSCVVTNRRSESTATDESEHGEDE